MTQPIDSLGLLLLALLESGVVVVDGLVDLRVLVCRHDERLALFGENSVGAVHVGVYEGSDLETGSELVLETERVASVRGCDNNSDSLPGAFGRTKHDVLRLAPVVA